MWLWRLYLWPYYLGRALKHGAVEVYDIVEFHWSRRRARKRLPSARALPPPD
jgi:hypothetical protein